MDGISRQLFLHLFVMKNQTKKQMFDWYDSPPAPRTDRRHKRQCIFERLSVDSETLTDGVLGAKEVHEEVPPFFVAVGWVTSCCEAAKTSLFRASTPESFAQGRNRLAI